MKTTNKIAGIIATFKKVLEPAVASAAASVAPELMAEIIVPMSHDWNNE